MIKFPNWIVAAAMLFQSSIASNAVAQQSEPITISVLSGAEQLGLHKEIATAFMAQNPGVRVKFRSPNSGYPDIVQQTLREALTGMSADVGFFGNYTIRPLIENDLAQPLDDLIATEKNWDALGYRPAMMSIAKFNDKVYGIPFQISLPIVFYNANLVKQAGGDPEQFPKTWDGIVDLGAKINALNNGSVGLWIRISDDTWYWQAMVFGLGGTMLNKDETKVAFGGPEGQRAINVLYRAGRDAKMPELTYAQAQQLFSAGKLGIFAASSSVIEKMTREAKGKFDMRAAPFPELNKDSRLPAGGNSAVVITKDPARRKAAWEYIKFATGPIGQNMMGRATGYMPVNHISLETPELLGDYFKASQPRQVSIGQVDTTTQWYAFPGANGLRIDELIARRLNDVIQQRTTPEKALPAIVTEVQGLL